MNTDYYIGSGDYFGENGPNEKFNKEMVPKLIKLGIKEKDMPTVANMFAEMYDIGYCNGMDNAQVDD
ncbi:MAG: hypothetical protein IJH39_07245 [Clostridia bacterium]|nr:hypothetical protein [Clostridia bacterium]